MPWTDPKQARLPGTAPVDAASWVTVDEVYDGQMALRDRLLAQDRPSVLAAEPQAAAALEELLSLGLDWISRHPGYDVRGGAIRRPDGVDVSVEPRDPLGTLGRLFQEDLCILQKPVGATEHVLTAAVLCFPAAWTLAEKIGRPLGRIHGPVDDYGEDVARRVQRLFDGLRVDHPLWRANAHLQEDPALFAPEREAEKTPPVSVGPFLRSERQVLLRLPQTGAILFSIHTYMVRIADLPLSQQTLIRARWPGALISDEAQEVGDDSG